MDGTRVVVKNKTTGKKKVLYYLGVPQQFQIYLALKDNLEFCPDPIDNDADFVQEEYDNVTIEMQPIDIMMTSYKKKDYAYQVLGKIADDVQREDDIFSTFIWKDVPRYKAEELIAAVGGIVKGDNYLLVDTGL